MIVLGVVRCTPCDTRTKS